MLEMQLDNQVQSAITQDELFSSSCLPEFIRVVTSHEITLKSLFVELPEEWPFEDQILSWLVPNLKDAIRKYHSDSGPGLHELYDDFIINKYDLMLKKQLLSILYEEICISGDTTCEDNMKNIIEDIKSKLSNNLYKNEEHVRLSLVARIVQTLGWNIWNPIEVNCEFNSVPNEDKTRVDMALFITQYSAPAVFMEIKAVGKTDGPALIEAEKQVRDYNRNNTATFSVITDGRKWRFYLSQTGGEFSHKCFRQVDLLTDASEDIEMVFNKFLSRLTISSDSARREAEHILNSSKKERAMIDALSKARSEILLPENSLISLVQLFIQKTHESGFNITEIEASVFIKKPCLKPMIVSNEPQIIPSITFGKAVLTSTTNRRRNRVFPKGCEVDGIHYNSANQAVKSLIRGGKLQQSDIPQLSYNAHKWLNENSNKFHFNYRRDV